MSHMVTHHVTHHLAKFKFWLWLQLHDPVKASASCPCLLEKDDMSWEEAAAGLKSVLARKEKREKRKRKRKRKRKKKRKRKTKDERECAT